MVLPFFSFSNILVSKLRHSQGVIGILFKEIPDLLAHFQGALSQYTVLRRRGRIYDALRIASLFNF